MFEFVPATREQVHSRICAHGPGGSGKTYTGLTVLHHLCGGQRFAVIDTERGRSKKYVGVNGWQFDIVEPHTFDPATLTEILGVAAGRGYPGIMIDSGSLYWNGQDGMMEQVDKRGAATGRNDKFGGGWKEMAPIERRMWDAVLTYPGHVWMTLRTASQYVIEEKERGGRTVATPRKVGLKPVQREGFEYEFDLVCAMDQENGLLVTKSDLLVVPQGTYIAKPTVEFAATIGEFCSEGVLAAGPMAYRVQALDPAASRADLLSLLAVVSRAGLINAPVTDEFEQPTVLGDLIKARGRALDTPPAVARAVAAAVATPREADPPAAAVTVAPAGAVTAVPPGSWARLNELLDQVPVKLVSPTDKATLIGELANRHLTRAGELTSDELTDVITILETMLAADDKSDVLFAQMMSEPKHAAVPVAA